MQCAVAVTTALQFQINNVESPFTQGQAAPPHYSALVLQAAPPHYSALVLVEELSKEGQMLVGHHGCPAGHDCRLLLLLP
jgi:hypothetical protein